MPCKIASISFPAPTIAHVVLRLPPNARFAFLAGQYIDIHAKGVKRSYSVANAPRSDGAIELYIRRFDGGVLSAYWFGEAAVGDLLRFEGPLGTFFLREEGAGPIVLLATGTGIAPVRALLEDIAGQSVDRPVFAYWGTRSREDFFWSPDPAGQAITFEPVLSRADPSWSGARGYVQDALLARGLDLGDASVYACGSEDMIRSAERQLLEAGLPKHRFFADPFLSSE
ncbi:MAG: NAD(P)H-flavin reductase [Alphaproteobacteria bacterium]|nr:NAD(P)H-flavin reductase [Alphaproteobacteria bacterium]